MEDRRSASEQVRGQGFLTCVKEAARRFFESYGMPIIPVGSDKRPLMEWKQYQEESMTVEQFDGLPWDKAANFAPVCGTLTKSGYYFVAIDVDKEIKVQPRTTMMEETPRGGRHHYYLSKANCKGVKLHDVGIELLASGQIVVVYGKWLNDNCPTVVECIEADFKDLAKAHGKTELTRVRQPLAVVLQPQPEGNRDKSIFDLVGALRDKNVPYETALATALATNDKYVPPLDQKTVIEKVQNAYKHLYQQPAANATPADTRETSLDEIAEILDCTIKEDRENKLITFASMLLNYTAEYQQNILFKCETTTGKSYIPLQIASFFPATDIVKFMNCSPKAFYHEYGLYDAERRVITVNLEKKILIFLDQQRGDLLKELRPLLSHDQKVLVCKITDRNKRQGHATKTVEIIGYPTVIFCSASARFSEQELTRAFILSPQTGTKKLTLTLTLLSERLSNPVEFQKWLDQNPKRAWLKGRIEAVKTARIQYVFVPEDLKIEITNRFFEDHKFLAPRHQRDLPRLYNLIQAHALLNFANRKTVEAVEGRSIEANRTDALEGYGLYRYIADSNELGLSPETFTVWRDLIKPKISDLGFGKRELQIWYRKKYHRNLNRMRLEAVLDELDVSGQIFEDVDPDDKRKKRYFPSNIEEEAEEVE